MDLRKFDKRIVDRNIDKGLVTPKDYQKYLSDLKNLEGEYDLFEVQPPDHRVSQEEISSDQSADNATEIYQVDNAAEEDA